MPKQQYFKLSEDCTCEYGADDSLHIDCTFPCKKSIDYTALCSCTANLKSGRSCYVDTKKVVDLKAFKKLTQSIPTSNPIYPCDKQELEELSAIKCDIIHQPLSNSNYLSMQCVKTYEDGPTQCIEYVPREILLKYKMEEEGMRTNKIFSIPVFMIYIIGTISLILFWKFGKKKCNKFFWGQGSQKRSKTERIEMQSGSIIKGFNNGTARLRRAVDSP